ncbi:MAG: DUF3253 domain-containing protein [Roseobacter sp.]
MTRPEKSEIAAVLMDLAHRRGSGKTFCPSEAARSLSRNNWRALMPDVRQVAAELPIVASQKGKPIDIATARGPIRLGLAPRD